MLTKPKEIKARLMLTKPKEIKARLQGYNRQWYDAITREIAALWNIEYANISPNIAYTQGSFPIWPRVDVQPRRTTEQRPILETCQKILSRVLSTNPVPEFSGIDEVQAEVRQKFWTKRADGDTDAEQDWWSEIRAAFMDGDALGCGVLHIGLTTELASNKQKITINHVPIRQVIWDATAVNPRRSQWVAVCEYLPVSEAEDLYGEDNVRGKITKLPTSTTNSDPDICPVWHYYDLGNKKTDPTYAIILGDIANNAFKVMKNPFGYMIPVSWMVGDISPGYQRPVGRVAKMLGSQISLNRQLDKLDKITMTNPGFTVMKAGLDPKMVNHVREGVPNVIIEVAAIDGTPAVHVPGSEASQTDLALLQEHRNELTRQGGLSELDRGIPYTNQKTATEVGYIQSGVEQSQSKVVEGTLAFLKETMIKVFKAAALYDRAPLKLNILGYPVDINGSDPRSTIDLFLDEPAELVLTSEALTGQDARVKQAQRQAALDKLAPLAAAGQINQQTWTEEYLKAVGERNVDRWIPNQEQTPQGMPSPDQTLPAGNQMANQPNQGNQIDISQMFNQKAS